MENFKNLIPVGFFLPFLVIILFEIAAGYILGIVETSLSNQVVALEKAINTKEEEGVKKLISNESFVAFSQLVNIVEILKNRNLVTVGINKFNSLMPKFLMIESFDFDNDKQEISFSGSVSNLTDYIRFLNYLNSQSAFELKSITPPQISKEGGAVIFSVIIKLKPDFYK